MSGALSRDGPSGRHPFSAPQGPAPGFGFDRDRLSRRNDGLVLEFVEDITRTFKEVHQVLRPRGRFAFSWMSPLCAITEADTLEITRSYFDRRPSVYHEKEGAQTEFHRRYGDWHRALTAASFVVDEILEPEPLPQENTYAGGFPLEKIRMIPGTTIWRSHKPPEAPNRM